MTQYACWYIYIYWLVVSNHGLFRNFISFLCDVIRKPLTSCPSFFGWDLIGLIDGGWSWGPGWYPVVSSNMASLLGRSWKCRVFPHAMFDETGGLPVTLWRFEVAGSVMKVLRFLFVWRLLQNRGVSIRSIPTATSVRHDCLWDRPWNFMETVTFQQ